MYLLCAQCYSGSGYFCCLLSGYNITALRNHITELTDSINPGFRETYLNIDISETESFYKLTNKFPNCTLRLSLTSLLNNSFTIEML